MPVVPSIATRAAAKAVTWGPIRNALAGAAAFFVKHYNDQAAEPGLEVWNTHASGTAPVFWVRDSLNGDKLIEVLQSGVTLRSPDATKVVTVTNAGISISGISTGVPVFNALDYGIVTGSDSTNAAANTAAFQALWDDVLAVSGVIKFPPGVFPLNASALTTATPGSIGVSVNIEGSGKNATVLKFYGPTGPFMNFSPSAGSIQRWDLKNLLIQHDSLATGPCLQFSGSIANINIEDVEIAAGGFLVGIQTAHSVNMFLTRCKINTRTDYATMNGVMTPIAMDLVNSATMGGLFLNDTELACCPKGGNPAALGTILRMTNTGAIDTVVLGDGVHLIGGEVGIAKVSGTGNVSNILIGKAYVTDTEVGIQLEPPSGSTCENWNFTGTWLDSREYNVLVTKPSGSTVRHLSFVGCYGTNATFRGMYFGPGVDGINLMGNEIMTSVTAAGRSGIEIGDGVTPSRDVNMVGGIIGVGNSTDGGYVIGSAVDGVTVAYVTVRGAAGVFNGATDASRVHVAGAVLATA